MGWGRKGKAAPATKGTWPHDYFDSPSTPPSRPADRSTWVAIIDALGRFGSAFGIHTVHRCDEDDQGWYCQLSRYYAAHHMIVGLVVFLLALAAVVYLAYRWWKRGHALKARASVALMLENDEKKIPEDKDRAMRKGSDKWKHELRKLCPDWTGPYSNHQFQIVRQLMKETDGDVSIASKFLQLEETTQQELLPTLREALKVTDRNKNKSVNAKAFQNLVNKYYENFQKSK